ncbi:DegT/DnrJ/EryC1/StrS family aminotransferase [Streptomyces sp. WAC05374]|uniref:DegT/DnrJ/EryC1/StrS aminotransferase family protein n=1 Tax=Streptomyces sp. WAC05374 TaxID=2487420 RepID=UPI000F873559|nr:DegT/DnrJ/EryC1/StrS family aminotransferase [Streptomyces sp. WAC05374]RST12896.1 DegT/DnrJ/EryC1/StrS family aminotransferase [Streptomyces sp. WAC05374]TDF42610.1 DegT/DnrJ/EryC1/StrS family aminotransferase [Streptomyces sp. WAC05374]TDF51170.1 DegT/DnrJ/EryC1/StrS family aminotransferase [Streptomyces sp. WAC05374]TDF52483.1 DegT/DnrJ/EryC1/StrS family aminotransferase [Streptomyces sp. WAC05374]
MGNALAISGGPRLTEREWPRWPQPGERALKSLEDVLTSGRWTISCAYQGRQSYERQFAAAFADYCRSAMCVPVATGTASLAIALEACGVGAGDEVIVPGLSWVASASAVLGINAVPVLVDVDPATYCLDPAAVESAITERTRAITVVHAYSAVADLDSLLDIAQRHGLPLIEDCAHAHGAGYGDWPVGAFGAAGVFSMQGSKLLTCGEGGALVTDDAEIANRAEHLRADGRVLRREPVGVGEMELEETGRLMGSNACLSEFHAAVLLDQLALLDGQNARRVRAADHLTGRLADMGMTVQDTSPGTTARAYYRYMVRLPDEVLAVAPVERIARALTAELGFPVMLTHRPLNDNPLHRPASRRRFATDTRYLERVDPARFDLPVAKRVHESVVSFGHEVLLAPLDAIDDIARAFRKVMDNVREIPH